MMKTTRICLSQLKKGNIVYAHGARFEVLEDARASVSHFPGRQGEGFGPTDCAVVRTVCLAGEVPGYFQPGSDWVLQGRKGAVFAYTE